MNEIAHNVSLMLDEQRLKKPNIPGDSGSMQSNQACRNQESSALLNAYLDNYLHSLGYCVKRSRLRWPA